MTSSPSPSPARDFLRSRPVPPSPSPQFDQWVTDCRELGQESVPELLAALRHGDEGEQYGALVCLRQFGYKAWGDGYDDDLTYTVQAPGGPPTVIVPDRP